MLIKKLKMMKINNNYKYISYSLSEIGEFDNAGAHAVLLSLWDIADLPTSKNTSNLKFRQNML